MTIGLFVALWVIVRDAGSLADGLWVERHLDCARSIGGKRAAAALVNAVRRKRKIYCGSEPSDR